MKIYKGLLLWYGPNMAPWFVIIESASGAYFEDIW